MNAIIAAVGDSHIEVQKADTASKLFDSQTNAAIKATTATITRPIGFAVIAALSAHCAAVVAYIAILLAIIPALWIPDAIVLRIVATRSDSIISL